VNIHLQGRFDDYPKRRGITRVKELQEAGINWLPWFLLSR
jgi:cytosine deaminase